jgi:pimeloyl-ACP methyl ester carboxylesterase
MAAPRDAATSFLTVSGHRLAYVWTPSPPADPTSPTLVFLHEGLGSIAQWRDLPDAVAERTGLSALVYDRWGSGLSERRLAPRPVTFMHQEALEVLPGLLGALKIERPILVGHSDGASIAIVCAGAGVVRVQALVLIAPHVFVEARTIDSIAAIRTTFERSDLNARLTRHHGAKTESMFRGWTDIWLDPAFRAWNIESYLAGIHCRVLVIQGEDDQYGSQAQVDAVRASVSGSCEALLLPACGHAPHIEQRMATEDAIVRFITYPSNHRFPAA